MNAESMKPSDCGNGEKAKPETALYAFRGIKKTEILRVYKPGFEKAMTYH